MDSKSDILRASEILLNIQYHITKHPNEVEKHVSGLTAEMATILDRYNVPEVPESTRISKLFEILDKERLQEGNIIDAYALTIGGIFALLSIHDRTSGSDDSRSILSLKQEATIRSAINSVLRLTFGALFTTLFDRPDKLIRGLGSAVHGLQDDSRTPRIYRIFLSLAVTPSSPSCVRLHSGLLTDCFAVLIACRLYFITRTELKDQLSELHDKLNEFSEVPENRQMIVRDLLLLKQCQPKAKINGLINRFLHQTFKQPYGMETLLEAVLDSDPHSESLTTITTRIASIANILVLLPVPVQENYFRDLIGQCLSLLQIEETSTKDSKHSKTVFWTLAVQVLLQIHSLNPSIVLELFKDLRSVLDGKDDHRIQNIDSVIEILHRMLTFGLGFPIEPFYDFFRPLIFVRFALEGSKFSPMKSILDQILAVLLKNIPDSVYLLDETINLDMDQWLNRYDTVLDSVELCTRIVFKVPGTLGTDSGTIESIQKLSNVLLHLLSSMPTDFVFDLFFLLLEQTIGDRKNILSILLLSSLGEKLLEKTEEREVSEERELLTNVKRIRFLSSTFERIVAKVFDLETGSDQEPEDEFFLFVETLKICISILVVIVEKLETLPLPETSRKPSPEVPNKSIPEVSPEVSALENVESIQRELRICEESLKKFFLNRNVSKILQNPLERIQAEDVLERLGKIIDRFREDSPQLKGSSSALSKALSNLREPLMPVRAHGLIVIKQLILSKDPSIQEQFQNILEAIRNLLLDSDSYLYLAAINALGALAIVHTDEVLDLLLEELISDSGKIQDRSKIGEVLMQLAKSIGDFAYHYSTRFVGKLLLGVRSRDPTIRVSSLVVLGKYCRAFKFGLSSTIVELVFMGQQLLGSDESLEVRRAAADFFRQLLEGLDKDNVLLIQDQLKGIKEGLARAATGSLDEVLRTHCALAYEELERIVKELIKGDDGRSLGFREVHFT